jgi:hypothetical protein
MRTEFIQTKVRPIKKLFILDESDFQSFIKILREISDEVDIIQNLILLNNGELFSEINKEFVRRHDPDIILNLSALDDVFLVKNFEVLSVKPVNDTFKIGRFGTNLFSFTTLPFLAEKFKKGLCEKVLASDDIENNPLSLMKSVNFGWVESKEKLYLDLTIFKDVEITPILTKEDIVSNILNNEAKFINLTNSLGSGSWNGTSIWQANYNTDNLFEGNKPYLFVSTATDLSSLIYFWNTRATYSYSKLAWIPEELLKEFSSLVDSETELVCLDDRINEILREEFPGTKIIKPSRYFFKGYNDRWSCFEQNQNVNINGDELVIQQPANKCFSDIGIGGACILEIRGLDEFIYPVRECLGDLYKPDKHNKDMFPERFSRISYQGFSKYILHFEPLHTAGLTTVIKLPTFIQIVSHLFEAQGYQVRRTTKSSIIEQLLGLLGGTSEAGVVCRKDIFDLLVSLTPKNRTEKVIEKLLGKACSGSDKEEILSLVGKAKETGAVSFPPIAMSLEQLLGKANIKAQQKVDFFEAIQNLYDKRLLLRGKSFNCLHCQSNVWLSLDDLRRTNYCYECGNEVKLPIYINQKPEADYYKLNQLVVRAVDQGQLSTILLLNYFASQQYRVFNHMANVEVFVGEKLVTDIDLIIRIGKKLGVCECKSNSGFDNKQIDDMLELSYKMKCDFAALSCLLKRDDKEVNEAISYIKSKAVDIPVFLFTYEELFAESHAQFNRYFEVSRSEEFIKGPVLVQSSMTKKQA